MATTNIPPSIILNRNDIFFIAVASISPRSWKAPFWLIVDKNLLFQRLDDTERRPVCQGDFITNRYDVMPDLIRHPVGFILVIPAFAGMTTLTYIVAEVISIPRVVWIAIDGGGAEGGMLRLLISR
jgi:phage shock protein PspC (stress-responsive transcriptional regulator)